MEGDRRTRWFPGTRGYHLDAFTSPFESLRTIVRQWKRADAHRKQTGSMADVIAFQCGRLAMPVQARGRARRDTGGAAHVMPRRLRPHHRADRRQPSSIGAVDVQDNRLEAEVSAWGLVEVEQNDASQLKGWGSHEFRGFDARWAAGIACDDGRWNIAGSMAILARPELWEQLAGMMERAAPARDRPDAAPRRGRNRHRRALHTASCRVLQGAGPGLSASKGTAPATLWGGPGASIRDLRQSGKSYGPEGLMLVCGNAGKASCFSSHAAVNRGCRA